MAVPPSLNTLYCPRRRVSQDASGTTLGHGKKEEHDDDAKLQPQPEFEDQHHCPAPLRLWNLDGALLQRKLFVDLDDGLVLFRRHRCLNGCLGDGRPRRGKCRPVRRTISAFGFEEVGQPSDEWRSVVEAPVDPVVCPCAYGVGQAVPVVHPR